MDQQQLDAWMDNIVEAILRPLKQLRSVVDKIWGSVQKIETDLENFIKRRINPLPKEFGEISSSIGGIGTGAIDAAAFLSHFGASHKLQVTEYGAVFPEIKSELDKLILAADMEGKITNPMAEFAILYGLLSSASQELLHGVLDVIAPDWSKLPKSLAEVRAEIKEGCGNDLPKAGLLERGLGAKSALIVLRGVSSSLTACAQITPLSVGFGLNGGVSAIGEIDAEGRVTPVRVGAVILLVKVACDIAHEIVSQTTR